MSFSRNARLLCAGLALAFLCTVRAAASSDTQDVVCNGGSGSFETTSTTGITISVGAPRNAGFSAHACAAKLTWNKQDFLVEPGAWQVDVDAVDIDLGLGPPVVAFQVKATDVDRLMKYEIYSLKGQPQRLREITGGDYYTAADTDLDGRVEIWTHDAAAADGFDNIPLYSMDFPPAVALRFERQRLLDVSAEFQPDFDRQIAAIRAQVGPQQLADFKASDGKLMAMFPPSLDQLHQLMATKIRVLEIVWAYLYSGREQDAWRALAAMWPASDYDRIRAAIVEARARGILRGVDGASQALPASHRKNQVRIYGEVEDHGHDPRAYTPASPYQLPANESEADWSKSTDFAPPREILIWRAPAADGSQVPLNLEVLVDLVIDAAGKVRSVQVLGAPDKGLVDAAAGWKFIPALSGHRPVAARLRLRVTPSQ